ncbi:MAG: acyl-CoA thioesterase [Rhodobacter sp.]|nr:acyl-CoA thioesterase [Rhodobacter sp.]
MTWSTKRLVEFQHCDPAGIVFYPRYFEMINSVIEEFFRDHVRHSFGQMHLADQRGVPTAKIAATFHAPSRLEDKLIFKLTVTRLGTTSVDFSILASCGDQERMSVQSTIVQIDTNTGKSTSWADETRLKLAVG